MKFKNMVLAFSLLGMPIALTSCNLSAKVEKVSANKITSVVFIGETVNGNDEYEIFYEDGSSQKIVIPSKGETKEEYTIRYYVDGRIYKTETAKHGSYLIKPIDPKKTGYKFDGWYFGEEKWVFIGFQVHCDLDLHAKFIKNEGSTTPDPTPDVENASYRILERENLRFTANDVSNANGFSGLTPSVGNPNLVVVPVEFSDLKNVYKFNATNIGKLNAAFNGTNPDATTSYNESVRSFYRKSSYGLLDLNFVIADPFTPKITSKTFINYESDLAVEAKGTYNIIEDFFANGKIGGIAAQTELNKDKYDIDNNHFVDGVWFIYNEHRATEGDEYWPYVFWTDELPSPNINKISNYANCAASFLYEDSADGIDTHTLIHETGHLLGLDDYYSYDFPGGTTAAAGGLDMMDFNIGDHNAYSKTLLGWTNPIIPTKSGEIKLKPFQENGDCIIISPDFNDSAFSEYLILEYYTPDGLNAFDATHQYPERTYYLSEPGLRIFHVDSRLAKTTVDQFGNMGPFSYLPSSVTNLNSLSEYLTIAHSNTRSRNLIKDATNPNPDLLALIPQDNIKLYGTTNAASNSCLFKTGNSFNVNKYKKFFSQQKYNNGTPVTTTIEVKDIAPEEITLQINL